MVDKIELQGSKKWILWSVWGVYTLFIIFMAFRHEPWYDEYHAWNLVYRLDFSHLWQMLHVEGHFCLWYLLLWPWVKWFGIGWQSLYIVSVPLMSLATWLILHKLRFPFIGKILIITAAPFLYHFPIVARCYALIPPILVGMAILYQSKNNPILYCVLLGLLANTHVYMEGLACILWLTFVYNYVWRIRESDNQRKRRNLFAASVTILLVIFAFVQVAGGLVDVLHGYNPPGEGEDSLEEWTREFIYGHRIMCFDLLHQKIALIPKMDTLLTLCVYVIAITSGVLLFIHKNSKQIEAFLVLFFGIAWQILFATNIYGMHNHRIWLPYFVVVLVLWMYFNQQEVRKYVYILLICCWLLFFPFYYKIWKDINYTMASEIVFAEKLEKIVPYDAILYSNIEDELECIRMECFSLDTTYLIQLDKIDCWVYTDNDNFTLPMHEVTLVLADNERYLYHIVSSKICP